VTRLPIDRSWGAGPRRIVLAEVNGRQLSTVVLLEHARRHQYWLGSRFSDHGFKSSGYPGSSSKKCKIGLERADGGRRGGRPRIQSGRSYGYRAAALERAEVPRRRSISGHTWASWYILEQPECIAHMPCARSGGLGRGRPASRKVIRVPRTKAALVGAREKWSSGEQPRARRGRG